MFIYIIFVQFYRNLYLILYICTYVRCNIILIYCLCKNFVEFLKLTEVGTFFLVYLPILLSGRNLTNKT